MGWRKATAFSCVVALAIRCVALQLDGNQTDSFTLKGGLDKATTWAILQQGGWEMLGIRFTNPTPPPANAPGHHYFAIAQTPAMTLTVPPFGIMTPPPSRPKSRRLRSCQWRRVMQPVTAWHATSDSVSCNQWQRDMQPVTAWYATSDSMTFSQWQRDMQPVTACHAASDAVSCSQWQRDMQPVTAWHATSDSVSCSQWRRDMQPEPYSSFNAVSFERQLHLAVS